MGTGQIERRVVYPAMIGHEGASNCPCLENCGLKDVFDFRLLDDSGSQITLFQKALRCSTFKVWNNWGDTDGFDSLDWRLATRDIALKVG
jgi:hypothetical protein